MIGKPVRYNQLQQYLHPLAVEAYKAGLTVPPLIIDGEEVMPPLPPASEYERVFYLPADAVTPSTRPDICEGKDFEKLLNNQTRASLRRYDDNAPPSNTEQLVPAPMDYDVNTTLVEEEDHDSSSTVSSRRSSSNSMEKFKQTLPPPMSSPPSKHHRLASMTISKRTLSKQILREVANADLDSGGQVGRLVKGTTSTLRNVQSRPQVMHRNSSPGWLLSDDTPINEPPSCNLQRPTLSSLLRTQNEQSGHSSGDYSESNESSESYQSLRRVSDRSTDSTSSDTSSAITTPACDSPLNFWSSSASHPFGFARAHERTLTNRTASPIGSLDSIHDVEKSWSASSETATANSSPIRIKTSRALEVSSSPCQPRQFTSLQDLAEGVGEIDLAS